MVDLSVSCCLGILYFKSFFYYRDNHELDLCDGEGTLFINTCWQLDAPETVRRELAAMALGRERCPGASGRLLYHEDAPGVTPDAADVMPAWKYLVEGRVPG